METPSPNFRSSTNSTTLPRSTSASGRILTVAVTGNPNSGKTTLFNALTGVRHKVGNYPGVTVEWRAAHLRAERTIRLLDLPGLYSLATRSPDEGIARDVLLGLVSGVPSPDGVLIVADASNLERNLCLAAQVIELGLPTVVACNKADLLERSGLVLDAEKLSAELGVPVVATAASRGRGVDLLAEALRELMARIREERGRRWKFSEGIEEAAGVVADAVRECGYLGPRSADGVALLLLDQDETAVDKRVPTAVRTAVQEARGRLGRVCGGDVSAVLAGQRYVWLREIMERCLVQAGEARPSMSDRADRVLTHPVWGNVCFAAVMGAMFFSVFALAAPLMDGIQEAVSRTQDGITAVIPAGAFRGLLRNGVLAGVGAVLSFFPQIAILFVFIGLLEDSGYMARAALLMNRLMSRVGLHGKSFIPLLSSFACTVPGVLAARTIENRRDRLATILIAPFMSCSARLPIYVLLIAACLPVGSMGKAAVLFGLYGLGILAAVVVAWVLKHTLLRGESPGFIIELPPYHVPRFKPLAMAVWDRCWQFLSKAGTVILAATIVLWAMMSYPRDAEVAAKYAGLRAAVEQVGPVEREVRLDELRRREQAEILEYSVAGRVGQWIEPAIRPLGFNWEIGVGMVASFAARELFVGTMGVIYSVGEADAASAPLREQMQSARWADGRPVFTPLVAVGLMVFYVLSCQCLSTIAVVRSETGSWGWPLLQLIYMTALAYGAALLIHQIGMAAGS